MRHGDILDPGRRGNRLREDGLSEELCKSLEELEGVAAAESLLS